MDPPTSKAKSRQRNTRSVHFEDVPPQIIKKKSSTILDEIEILSDPGCAYHTALVGFLPYDITQPVIYPNDSLYVESVMPDKIFCFGSNITRDPPAWGRFPVACILLERSKSMVARAELEGEFVKDGSTRLEKVRWSSKPRKQTLAHLAATKKSALSSVKLGGKSMANYVPKFAVPSKPALPTLTKPEAVSATSSPSVVITPSTPTTHATLQLPKYPTPPSPVSPSFEPPNPPVLDSTTMPQTQDTAMPGPTQPTPPPSPSDMDTQTSPPEEPTQLQKPPQSNTPTPTPTPPTMATTRSQRARIQKYQPATAKRNTLAVLETRRVVRSERLTNELEKRKRMVFGNMRSDVVTSKASPSGDTDVGEVIVNNGTADAEAVPESPLEKIPKKVKTEVRTEGKIGKLEVKRDVRRSEERRFERRVRDKRDEMRRERSLAPKPAYVSEKLSEKVKMDVKDEFVLDLGIELDILKPRPWYQRRIIGLSLWLWCVLMIAAITAITTSVVFVVNPPGGPPKSDKAGIVGGKPLRPKNSLDGFGNGPVVVDG
ncbi:hypothetical protein HK096_003452 [Nowakowskiella sp. JEL0078]|nr:hypothetical protein HK096_003452 [Nowakowskiella sp. JEL0078]